MTSIHYTEERQRREDIIKVIGYGEIIKTVEVDRGHRNGPEIHEISNTGIITILNKNSHKMITKLIARPGQIKRYFTDEPIPQGLLEKAFAHQRLGLNNI